MSPIYVTIKRVRVFRLIFRVTVSLMQIQYRMQKRVIYTRYESKYILRLKESVYSHWSSRVTVLLMQIEYYMQEGMIYTQYEPKCILRLKESVFSD